MTTISASNLRKEFGETVALDGLDLSIEEGRIVGILGANGAGKSTALRAFLGLTSYEGELRVLDRDPFTERDELMRDVSFIADVAVLPRWIRVSQLIDYVAAIHPRFDRAKAEGFLEKTTIGRKRKVGELSKGMLTQLHLAIVMAIDARLLVLDEPTIGLDLIYRKRFYDTLLDDYFNRSRTVVIATQNIEEIEHVVTDVIFLDRGKIVFSCATEELEARFAEVSVQPDQVEAARELHPLYERDALGRAVMIFEAVEREKLNHLGNVRTPSIADLFMAQLG